MKKKYLQRTRFAADIVAEFMPPSRKASKKVLIVAEGAPGMPGKKALAEEYSRRGYWVFLPRYRGTWESDGTFLKHSPTEDIRDVLDGISKGFIDSFDGSGYQVEPSQVVLLGHSFGGPACALLSCDTRVDKVVLLSPVVDWRARSKIEPLEEFFRFTREGFGGAYRFAKDAEQKLRSGTFYNPGTSIEQVCGEKLLIMHAEDDEVVLWKPVRRFATQTGAQLVLRKRGGHLSSSVLLKPGYDTKIHRFLEAK